MPIATPFKPVGIGHANAAVHVFQIVFSQALSAVPILTSWDDYNMVTTLHDVHIGTTVNGNLSMIGAVGGIAPGTNWFPTSATAGNTAAGTANLLKGSTSGVQISSTIPGAGGVGYFNLDYRFPSDVTTLSTMESAIACQYQYTGPAPTLTWNANNGGTEGVPIWTTIFSQASGVAPTPGTTTQIRPCDTGTGDPSVGGDGTYRQTIPTSGQVYPNEIWVKNF